MRRPVAARYFVPKREFAVSTALMPISTAFCNRGKKQKMVTRETRAMDKQIDHLFRELSAVGARNVQ